MDKKIYIDQVGRKVEIPMLPVRVVCLVPSISELVNDLGIGNRFVGTTKFCIHPKELKNSTTRIGGTKKINLDKIDQLVPDLIIANKEENTKEQIEALLNKYTVWISDISNLNEALEMISSLGQILNAETKAKKIHDNIASSFKSLVSSNKRSCLYLIWNNPYMAAGKGTFIDDLLSRSGFENILADETRYPEISSQRIKKLQPEFIFLSSEPYPFKEKHIEELSIISPESKIMLVDGELFSWYGSRLLKSSDYFETLLHY